MLNNKPSIKIQAKTFKFAANHEFVGKTGEGYLSHSRAYEVKSANFKLLARHIGQGYPWMPVRLDAGSRRHQVHANTTDLLALDIDNSMTIADAMSHPYAQYLGLGIESNSSTPEHHKFRLVFRLAEPITVESGGWKAIKAALTFLAQEFDNLSDPQCKDASRYYFGAKGRKPFHLSETATLPVDFMDRVVENEIRLAEEERKRQAELQKKREAFLRSCKHVATLESEIDRVREALRHIPARQKGSGNYGECIRILMALNAAFGSEIAEQLAEEWSPSSKSDKWNVAYKISTFSNNAIRLGTIFHIAKRYGYRPKPSAPRKLSA